MGVYWATDFGRRLRAAQPLVGVDVMMPHRSALHTILGGPQHSIPRNLSNISSSLTCV